MSDDQTKSPQILESLEKILYMNIDDAMEGMMHMPWRSYAIVAAAYLDEQLKELLKDFFINKKTISKQIIEGMISSFASRIDLAFLHT